MNSDTLFNFIIFKDATASALQLLTLVLNVRDKQLTEIFNLNSKSAWFDPYTYIISLFLKDNIVEDKYKGFFIRKYLKKTIMTYNYSATLYTCLQGFYEEIKAKTLKSDDKKNITQHFISFYRFLEKLFDGKNFFEKSITDINEQLLKILKYEKDLIIYLNDESSAYLQYYTKRERRANLTKKGGVRTTTVF
jgi:hypothetical protein